MADGDAVCGAGGGVALMGTPSRRVAAFMLISASSCAAPSAGTTPARVAEPPSNAAGDSLCGNLPRVINGWPRSLETLARDGFPGEHETLHDSQIIVPGSTSTIVALPGESARPRWEVRWADGAAKEAARIVERITECGTLAGWSRDAEEDGVVWRVVPADRAAPSVHVRQVPGGPGVLLSVE